LAGDGDGALVLVEQCLEQIKSSDGVPPQLPLLERIRGIVLMGRGDDAEGRAALEASLKAARARDANYEVALTLRALVETASGPTGDDVVEWHRRSDEILRELGVEWVPTMVRVGD
jgi:hypothetical protein